MYTGIALSVCTCMSVQNPCPVHIFLMEKHQRVFIYAQIAYDLKVGNDLDLRSFGQVQSHCLNNFLKSVSVVSCINGNNQKVQFDTKLPYVRRNRINCSNLIPARPSKIGTPTVSFLKNKCWEKNSETIGLYIPIF